MTANDGKHLNVAIVGCGDISHAYASTISQVPSLRLKGVWNRTTEKARALAHEFHTFVYPDLDALLDDPAVDVVVNLTTQKVHADIVRRCLLAGKHVHSEKPLAATWQEATELAKLAESKGLRLSVCPITFMGEAQQTVLKALQDGMAGTVRAIYAEVNWHRLEGWHPNPEPFYEVGPHYDVAVYPLSVITAFLGPAVRVQAYSKLLLPERRMPDGRPFQLHTPDFWTAMIELASGAVVRLTSNFYVSWETKQRGIEFHGDAGSIFLSSWESFDAQVEFAPFGEGYSPIPLVHQPFEGIDWARALVDLQSAIETGQPHRASAELGIHTLEILNAMDASASTGKAVDLHTTFIQPKPVVEWPQSAGIHG
jgi:predicted dehydrogenase